MKINKEILQDVKLPARYVGGEFNQVKKHRNVDLNIVLCYPAFYEDGMSSYEFRYIYSLLNNYKNVWCTRAFMPDIDMVKKLEKEKIKLYALETMKQLKTADILIFLVDDVLHYTNVIKMLEMSGINAFSKDRENYPFVVGYGKCMENPFTMDTFFDIQMIGDNKEDLFSNLVTTILDNKKSSKNEILDLLKYKDGFYIKDKTLNVKKNDYKKITDIEYFPNYIVSNMKIKKDGILLKLKEGNVDISYKILLEYVKLAYNTTGQKNVYLESKKLPNYKDYKKLIDGIKNINKNSNIFIDEISIDDISSDFLEYIKTSTNNIDVNIYAGSYELRKKLDVDISDEKIIENIKLILNNEFKKVCLKFYIGIPTETYKDLEDIITLITKIKNVTNSMYTKGDDECIKVKFEIFDVKPHTKFQYSARNKIEKLELKYKYLKSYLDKTKIYIVYDDVFKGVLKQILSISNSCISNVIYQASKDGAILDRYYNNMELWKSAFEKNKISFKEYMNKDIDTSDDLDIDKIDVGIKKDDIIKKYNNIKGEKN